MGHESVKDTDQCHVQFLSFIAGLIGVQRSAHCGLVPAVICLSKLLVTVSGSFGFALVAFAV